MKLNRTCHSEVERTSESAALLRKTEMEYADAEALFRQYLYQ